MGTFETIGFGFDIATAISVIGAAFAFIVSARKENKRKLQKEKVSEMWEILQEFKGYMKVFIDTKNEFSDPFQILTDVSVFLRTEALPAFVIFATKEDIEDIIVTIKQADEAAKVWVDSDKSKDSKIIKEALDKCWTSMLDVERKLAERLRNQIHENKSETKKIIALYQDNKFQRSKFTYYEKPEFHREGLKEISEILKKFRINYLSKFLRQIESKEAVSLDQIFSITEPMQQFLELEALPVFVIFSNQAAIESVGNTIKWVDKFNKEKDDKSLKKCIHPIKLFEINMIDPLRFTVYNETNGRKRDAIKELYYDILYPKEVKKENAEDEK